MDTMSFASRFNVSARDTPGVTFGRARQLARPWLEDISSYSEGPLVLEQI
ncbi:MAG TPA: hypothetical protein VMA73_08375 [Streptosporangiaceae bacterium]|nr:hypothetical protein [Streptosporangiaceae bacterium]